MQLLKLGGGQENGWKGCLGGRLGVCREVAERWLGETMEEAARRWLRWGGGWRATGRMEHSGWEALPEAWHGSAFQRIEFHSETDCKT